MYKYTNYCKRRAEPEHMRVFTITTLVFEALAKVYAKLITLLHPMLTSIPDGPINSV